MPTAPVLTEAEPRAAGTNLPCGDGAFGLKTSDKTIYRIGAAGRRGRRVASTAGLKPG